MTFGEFVSSRHTAADLAAAIGDHGEGFRQGEAGFWYGGSADHVLGYIRNGGEDVAGGKYALELGNQGWQTDDLEQLEKRLYAWLVKEADMKGAPCSNHGPDEIPGIANTYCEGCGEVLCEACVDEHNHEDPGCDFDGCTEKATDECSHCSDRMCAAHTLTTVDGFPFIDGHQPGERSAAAAERALAPHPDSILYDGWDEDTIVDLLTGLMHLCDGTQRSENLSERISFGECLGNAYRHFHMERTLTRGANQEANVG